METFQASAMKTRRIDKGQGLVEFALVFPILILFIFGIIEFGRMLAIFSSVSAATREGARYAGSVGSNGGIPHYQDCDGIRAAVGRVSLFADPSIVIEYDTDGSGGVYCPNGTSVDPISVSLGTRITVTVISPYQPILPIGLPDMQVKSEMTRTVLTGIPAEE